MSIFSSLIHMQLHVAPKRDVCTLHHFMCKLWHSGYARSYKVIDFRLNRTLVCDFLSTTQVLIMSHPFYRAMMIRRARLCHSKSSVRPSVCPSVTFWRVFHTNWNTSKTISRLIGLRYLVRLTHT